MKVSVIIPVYMAAKYVAKAVESALAQQETHEVLLIEDGSTDNSLDICKTLVQDGRVRLLTHPGNVNLGASASRNLGIRNATMQFIAFLDADDIYVPGRFVSVRNIFNLHPDADGVYAHIGATYYDDEYKAKHLERMPQEISGMHSYVPPEDLLTHLLSGKGHISVDSLVVKREILTDDFLFDESLGQAEDTDFMYRLSSKFRLYSPVEVTLVAMRGVHPGNRVFNTTEGDIYSQRVLLKCMRENFYGCRDKRAVKNVMKKYLRQKPGGLMSFLAKHKRSKLAYYLFMLSHPIIAIRILRLT